MEKVTKFDLKNAFKALDDIEIPKAILTESIRKLPTASALTEEFYDIDNQEDMNAVAESREDEIAKAKLAKIEKIVDLDAQSPEDLEPSYAGKTIIQCPQCMTMFYKNPEDVIVSENDPNTCNVGEKCQHCGNESGYTLVGKVAPVSDEELSNFEAAPEEAPAEENEFDLDFEETPEEETEKEAEPEENVEEPAEEPTEEEAEEEDKKEESYKNKKKAGQLHEDKSLSKVSIICKLEGIDWEETYSSLAAAIAALEAEEEAASSDDPTLENAFFELKTKVEDAAENGIEAADCELDEKGNVIFSVEYELGESLKHSTLNEDAHPVEAKLEKLFIKLPSEFDYDDLGVEISRETERITNIGYGDIDNNISPRYETTTESGVINDWGYISPIEKPEELPEYINKYLERDPGTVITEKELDKLLGEDYEAFEEWLEDYFYEAAQKDAADTFEKSQYNREWDYCFESLKKNEAWDHKTEESDQVLHGTDNAVVDCKVAKVVTHSEDEKPVDCEGKKKPLEKPLTETIEDIDDASVNECVSKFLKEVYENVSGFEMTDCSLNEGKLIIEGNISFKSGNVNSTNFAFNLSESLLEGYNKALGEDSKFDVSYSIKDNALYFESMKYNLHIDSKLVEGLIK